MQQELLLSISYLFVSETTDMRNQKSLGTNKIIAYCTVTLTIKSDKHTELISVEQYDTYYDHDKQLGHLMLKLMGQLAQSIPVDGIFDGIRDLQQYMLTN